MLAFLALEKFGLWLVACTHLLGPPVGVGMLALRALLISQRQGGVCLIYNRDGLFFCLDHFPNHARLCLGILGIMPAGAHKEFLSFFLFWAHE